MTEANGNIAAPDTGPGTMVTKNQPPDQYGSDGYRIVTGVQKSWRNYGLVAMALFALSITLPLMVFLYISVRINFWWLIPVTLIVFAAIEFVFKTRKVRDMDAAKLLNNQHPQLEESTALLLKPEQELGFLEKLQVKKVSAVLIKLESCDTRFRSSNPGFARIKKAILLLALSFVLAMLVYIIGPRLSWGSQPINNQQKAVSNQKPEKVLPSISGIAVTIDPPAYTGVATRNQQRLNMRAEQGSKLTWQLNTKGNPSLVQLIFNDSTVLDLESLNKMPGAWSTEKRISSNGFYQVKIDNELSEFYQLEIISDKQPTIVVQTPKPSTIIEYGQSQQVPLNLVLTDDYGISSGNIIATIASGNGEAVKFKEQKLAFNQFEPGGKEYKLNKTFNLPGMDMQPGDELYFYIIAIDNNKQETKSDIFTVKLEDTSALMSMDGMMSGVDIKPEFFRSQRQIIIETEQLLKGRDTMSKETFNNRCNDLGIDQKLLRLRYGKFLGEESETNIGEDGNNGHDHDGEKPKEGDEHDDDHDEKISVEDFNNAEKIIDRYAHKHDIAEDATFFDPQTKKDLKAVLAEMWDAELRLRTYKPTDALPYEYKALRLLKELQQKSREYVAKTNSKTTPLKPEKRLTGELDKIVERSNSQAYQALPQKELVLKTAMTILDQMKDQILNSKNDPGNQDITVYKADNKNSENNSPNNKSPNNKSPDNNSPNNKSATNKSVGNKKALPAFSNAELEVLEQTAGQLSLKASADPRLFLPSFEAIQRIIKNEGTFSDLITTGKALQIIVKHSTRTPESRQSAPDMKLSKEYFINLNKSTRGS